MSEALLNVDGFNERNEGDRETLGARNFPKLLLVDDRPENLFALERVLAPLDAETHRATSGQEALGLMLRHQYAAVLLDVQMPEMDGFETASLMREYTETRDVPVIFVTAISKEQRYVKTGYETGAVDYLLKPIDPDILLSKVKVFLDLEAQRSGLKEALSTIRRISHRQKLILNCADEGILGLDPDGRVVFSNPAAERLLKTNDSDLCGIDVKGLFVGSEENRLDIDAIFDAIRDEGRYRAEDSRFHRFDGSDIPVDFSAAAIHDEEQGFSGSVLVFNDITERKNVEQQLMRLARYDELTGLANRTLFREFLRKSMARAKRGGRLMGLLFVDLDRFKAVNDEHGHSAGDKLLRSVGKRIVGSVREGDLVARLGGDEFAIVLDEIDSPDSVGGIAEKVIAELSTPHVIEGHRVTIHTSIGISVFSGDEETADALIRKADTAMYEAKRRGRNGYRYFSGTMDDGTARSSLLVSDLRAAIANQSLTVHFQPQFCARDGTLLGFEALARWYDEERGFIPPDEFIPLAEESGLIDGLGQFVMKQACHQLATWRQSGHVSRDCRMAVNVSVMQLHSEKLVNIVQSCLRDEGLEPRDLEIELTESTVMDDAARAIEQLNELNRLGVSVAIDDFGTGYSSLSYLQRLPIDSLKIDKSFVQGLGQTQGNEAIVQSILALAASLSLNVVAEGVETEDQRTYLAATGCDVLQGYLLGRPLDAEQIQADLEQL